MSPFRGPVFERSVHPQPLSNEVGSIPPLKDRRTLGDSVGLVDRDCKRKPRSIRKQRAATEAAAMCLYVDLEYADSRSIRLSGVAIR